MNHSQRRENPFSVLIVDDEPGMLDVLSSCFADEGYNVYTAQSGSDALRIFPEIDPDLIITDVRMPNGDGRTLIRDVRALGEDAPIIFCISGYQDMTPPEIFLNGIDHFFPKPLDFDTILCASNHFLNNRRTRRSDTTKPNHKIESLDSLNTILHNLHDFFFILDSNLHFKHCSKSFAKAHETTEYEICMRSFLDFLTPSEAREFRGAMGDVLAGKLETSIFSLSTSREGPLPVEVSWARGCWQNESVIFALARDLTSQAELEKRVENRFQNDLMLIKTQLELAASLGQDLRTPLQAIVGYASMLENSSASSRDKRFTQSIIKAANSLSTLMNEFLTIANAGSVQPEASITEFSLPQMINEVVNLVNTGISTGTNSSTSRGKVSAQLTPSMNFNFRGKPLCLRQVLTTLLKKAVQHSSSKQIFMHVALTPEADTIEFVFRGTTQRFEPDMVCSHLITLLNGTFSYEHSTAAEQLLRLTVPTSKS